MLTFALMAATNAVSCAITAAVGGAPCPIAAASARPLPRSRAAIQTEHKPRTINIDR
jgi:hypothetical protein